MSHPNGPRTGRSPVYAPRGMVATSHYLASAAGLRALQRGGSAVDAAIAANTVLCVAYPHMAGLGGDGFWLIYDPFTQAVLGLNASGPAAQAASPDFYRSRGCEAAIPSRGPLAALTVPGAVDGWRLAHEKFGQLDWADLFTEAIYYARQGVPISRSLADWLANDVSLLQQFSDTARTFLPQGKPGRIGERLVLAGLANTLEQLAKQGPRQGFYEGAIATQICQAYAMADSPLQPEDFARFQAEWVQPIMTDYRGHTVYSFPPNTQGFAALQILNLIEGFDVAGWGDSTVDYYHHLAEAVKLAFADRDEWLSDPKWIDIPLDQLLSKDYAAQRRSLIHPDSSLTMENVKAGVPFNQTVHRRSPGGDTCYFCAVDDNGLVVSSIQSIYHDFGSAVVGGDTGVILQNRGAFFALDEQHPNALAPGKRTFHTLIPSLMLRQGAPYLAYGTMGGEGQPQTQAAMVTRLIDFGYDVQQAIEAPRWLMGRTWGTQARDLFLEGRIADNVSRELKLRGQPVKRLDDWNDNMGHAQAIRIHADGFLEGGADPRGDGIALGY